MPAPMARRLSPGILVALFLASALVTARAPETRAFTLAMLRRDGVLVPFASFDGDRWSNKWPAQPADDIPIALSDVPGDWWFNKRPITQWTAWLPSGVRQKIVVDAPAVIDVQCTRRVGLRSSYVAIQPPPPPGYQPYPKDGLAASGDVAIEGVQLVEPGSPEAAAFAKTVADSVNAAETKRVRDWRRQWSHPVDEQGRAKTPISIELLARSPGAAPGSIAYYFEGVKKYPGFMQSTRRSPLDQYSARRVPRTEMCDYLTFAGGWLMTNAKREAIKAAVGAELTNCNREGINYTLPLGVIRAAGRVFWIGQVSGWETESYFVIEIKANEPKPVIMSAGGSCG